LQELQRHAAALQARGVGCEMLDREATLIAEPALGQHATGALLVHGEGAIDNRRLGRALTAACEAKGVVLVRGAYDVAVECDKRRVLGVRSQLGFAPASSVVIAAGAWSGRIEGVPAECAPHVTPVKGQMLALAMPRGFVRHTTWVPGAYLVPRDDGRLLIGATVEHVGFDERVTAAGLAALLDAALAAAPSLGSFAVSETWAGLRPGTPDGRPAIGPCGIEGLVMATGHYRNGILLAPVTAAYVADFIERGDAEALTPWVRMTSV
jgi:glycine oxidase